MTVEYHWLEGHYDRLPAVIADLVRRRVDVIVTSGFTQAALAAKTATATNPTVFGVGEDPVKLFQGMVPKYGSRAIGSGSGTLSACAGSRLERQHRRSDATHTLLLSNDNSTK